MFRHDDSSPATWQPKVGDRVEWRCGDGVACGVVVGVDEREPIDPASAFAKTWVAARVKLEDSPTELSVSLSLLRPA